MTNDGRLQDNAELPQVRSAEGAHQTKTVLTVHDPSPLQKSRTEFS